MRGVPQVIRDNRQGDPAAARRRRRLSTARRSRLSGLGRREHLRQDARLEAGRRLAPRGEQHQLVSGVGEPLDLRSAVGAPGEVLKRTTALLAVRDASASSGASARVSSQRGSISPPPQACRGACALLSGSAFHGPERNVVEGTDLAGGPLHGHGLHESLALVGRQLRDRRPKPGRLIRLQALLGGAGALRFDRNLRCDHLRINGVEPAHPRYVDREVSRSRGPRWRPSRGVVVAGVPPDRANVSWATSSAIEGRRTIVRARP